MKRLVRLAAATAITMAAIAGVVLGLGDRTLLVPPPESVAEGFVRQLDTGRYARALPFLSAGLKRRADVDTMRAAAERLTARGGEILDVKGETVSIEGDRARARALLQTKEGAKLTMEFPLVREEGVWAIDGLGDLDPGV